MSVKLGIEPENAYTKEFISKVTFVIPCLTRNPVFLLDSRWSLPRTTIRGGNDNLCGLTSETFSTNKVISMKTLIIKSLLTSLYQREEWFDKLTMTFVILSLSKDGKVGTTRNQEG